MDNGCKVVFEGDKVKVVRAGYYDYMVLPIDADALFRLMFKLKNDHQPPRRESE